MADHGAVVAGSRGQRELALALQAALLHLDACVRERPPGGRHVSENETTTSARKLATAIREVHSTFQDVSEYGTAGLCGVPAWLGPSGEAAGAESGQLAGLALLQARLASAERPWTEIREHLDAESAGYRLRWLIEEWPELRRQSHPSGWVAKEPGRSQEAGVTVLFPTVHNSGNGLLVEMTLRPRVSTASPPATDQQTRRFREGLTAGRLAAQDLARKLGVPHDAVDLWDKCDASFRGIPASHGLDDTSAGTATAVALIQHLLGLPALDRLVTGQIGPDGVVGRLPTKADLAAKEQAAIDHGLCLLPLQSGWRLDHICSLLWPESWYESVARTAERGLQQLGHEMSEVTSVQTGIPADEWNFAQVRLGCTDDVFARMRAGAPAIVIGGPRSSARTTAARQAALAWKRQKRTPVIELRLQDGMLPKPGELAEVITLARHAAGIRPGAQAVVILEDLLPYLDAADLDGTLSPTAERTSSILIAICLYAGGNRWRTDETATVPSLTKDEDIRLFSNEFARVNDLNLDDGTVSLARRASAGDIWWLVRLLLEKQTQPRTVEGESRVLARAATDVASYEATEATEATEAGDEPEGLAGIGAFTAVRRAYVRRVHRRANAVQLDQIRAVAAASLLRVAIPAELLTEDVPTVLMGAGAQRDRRGRWYIARTATCRALLASDDGLTDPTGREWLRPVDAQYEALATLLRPHLHTFDLAVTSLITALLTASKVIEPGLHSRLLTLVTPALSRIEVDAEPALVARALLSISSEGPDEGRQHLFEVLIQCVSTVGWRALTVREATTFLRAIRSYRDYADWRMVTVYQDVLEQIGEGMKRSLSTTDPMHGVLFIHELGRLWDEKTVGEITPLAVAATTRCDAGRIEHYEAAAGLVDAALNYGDDRRLAMANLAQAPGIRRLLNADVGHDAGLILAQSALRLMLGRTAGDLMIKHQRVGTAISATLKNSRPTSVIVGLGLVERIDVRAGRLIVGASKMGAWLRGLLLAEAPNALTPWQTAMLIRTLGKVDARSVISALYNDRYAARTAPEIIDALAASVIQMGDLKGVGHVVSAVNSVDAFWGADGPDSAAAQLCAGLRGFIEEALESETRGSVMLAVVSALVEAEIPEEPLRSLLERCVDVVVTEARDNQKDHAPRLALLLGQQETVGPEFLKMLDPLIDNSRLLNRMTHSPAVEARAAYMDLARALRRTTDEEFRRDFIDTDWLDDSKPLLRGGSVLSSLKALRAYTRLLRDVGMAFAEENVLRAIDEDPHWWAERLKRLYHPAHWSEALHLLHQLAPRFAVKCLGEFDALYRPEARYGGRLRPVPASRAGASDAGADRVPTAPSPARIAALQQRKQDARRQFRGLLRLAQRRFVQPEDAVKLVHAVRAIDHEAGRNLGAALSDERWERRVNALLDTDAPVHLGNQLRLMAKNNLALPTTLQQRLFDRWGRDAYDYRSPAVAQSLIRGFAASGPGGAELAERLAEKLNLDRIALRLERGLPRDMAAAPALAGALEVWGPEGSAEQVAAAIPADAIEVVDAPGAVRLMLVLPEVCTDKAGAYAAAAVRAISTQSSMHYVADPETHWRELGWLVRLAHAAGGDVPDGDTIVQRLEANCRQPEIVAWVAGCLGRYSSPEAWLTDSDHISPWVRAAQLLVHSEVAPEGTPLPSELGPLLRRVSIRWQIHLLRRAAHDHRLRRMITDDDIEHLLAIGNDHLEAGRPSGAVLLRAVDDIEPPYETPDQRR